GYRSTVIHFGHACNAPDDHPTDPKRVSRSALFKDHRLLTFALCLFLFQVANASMLPILGERLVQIEGRSSSLVVSALIVFPQMIVALLAPWAGRSADTWGRRPLFTHRTWCRTSSLCGFCVDLGPGIARLCPGARRANRSCVGRVDRAGNRRSYKRDRPV